MKSTEFLQSAIDTQAERGKQYDSPEGERSMGRTVQAFNAITGRDLTEAEGWLLLQVLKDVRQWSAKGYHHDSALDGVAYASLKAEALCNAPRPFDPNAEQVLTVPFQLPRDGGWLEHDGRGCPSHLVGLSVKVRRHNGTEWGPHPVRAHWLNGGNDWSWHTPGEDTIEAYKVVQNG